MEGHLSQYLNDVEESMNENVGGKSVVSGQVRAAIFVHRSKLL